VNWDAIGAIGEIVGAVAVVATLSLLVRETRTNTKAVIGAAMRTSSLSFADFNTRIAAEPDLARNAMKGFEKEMNGWTEADWFRFQMFARAECDRMGDLYRQYRFGNFDAEEADWYLDFFRGLLEYPAWRAFWQEETKGPKPIHGRDFVDNINSRAPAHTGLSELRSTGSSPTTIGVNRNAEVDP
jgi:hypothetical protein